MKPLEILLSKRWILKDREKELYYQLKDEIGKSRDFLTEKLGYQAIITPNLIKLEKIPAYAQNWMGIQDFSDHLEYIFLCMILMFLEDRDAGEQFVLSMLTEYIQANIKEEQIDWTIYSYRRHLVKVMKYCVKIGILEIDDGSGEKVTAVAKSDKVSVSAKATYIRSMPGKNGKKLARVYLGTGVERVAVCDNGWSKVTYEKKSKKGTEKISGYVPTKHINDSDQVAQAKGTFTALKDSDILDYPGKKDGQVVGEVIQEDEVKRLATVNGIWSQIYYKKENGKRGIGYIPTSVLENTAAEEKTEESKVAKVDGEEAGTIHKSEGKGVFAEAVDGVTASKGEAVSGVQVGTPIAVSSDATLKPLGTFKITHYCPCSICCGPWANGVTSTGVTATTNRTIAVDPTQIPYGSKVVINGQVYVAEDCGGAIKHNCIDIYVATHQEGEDKGVYYTDVYLLE